VAGTRPDFDRIVQDFLTEARGKRPRRTPPLLATLQTRPLPAELAAVLRHMQSPRERAAIDKAFHATAEELADAAVAAAKRRRG